MLPFLDPCRTISDRVDERPRELVFPAKPKQIAQRMAHFPDPFGPTITFKFGREKYWTDLYDL